MSYVIFKEGNLDGKKITVLVNDSEGIAIEFETFESAQNTAELFENNSLSGNKFFVKEIR
jgi:hypothetical protein